MDEQTLSKLYLPASIVIAALIVSGAMIYTDGSFSIKTAGGLTQDDNQVNPPPDENPTGGSVKVSIAGNAVLGNKNAPLTLIEFSDFECPFCKRSFNDVLPSLKKEYIDTGKVKFVYRDFPLPGHANAHKEAEAAECAKSQGGDSAYYKFHDQILTQTTSNGTGLALTQLPVIAKSLGLNVSQFQQCLDSDKFKNEVDKDLSDGTAAGVQGTPSWFLGKSTPDGTIEGTLLVGAQPYSAFKTAIDQMLAQ